MKKLILAVASIFLLGGCAANETKQEGKDKEQLSIVTSFYPMYDFTKNVVGDKAKVDLLIEAGVEPHDYEPSAKDMAKIQEADVFIYNSNEMETWVKDVLKGIDTKKVKVIEASKGIDFMEAAESDNEHGDGHKHAIDPHVWLSPILARQEVNTIAKELQKIDKKSKDEYEKNAADYSKKLNDLNQEFVSATENATNKKFVTQHQAFSYLAREYGLTQIAISGLSPEQEPTPKELKVIEDVVKNEKINVIYTESSASSKVAKTISDATGAKLSVLNPLESMSDKDRDDGKDYISVMKDNLKALQESIK
ncbi:metal ABC transporter substrate-binding protein [Vagococcus silagei]|uniref:Zinc ABC transporter substrate-binding protein n=1 Tax=Vagococcus silagei TaxID=2508885 RepID=A0A4S3B6Y6_9ENTE|nr:metal ABC transporter substrate-binding protein [Vagococcus silagei]THB62197.1 zinc ABC transporter substrate-binding protein [Vagococcus silagei]